MLDELLLAAIKQPVLFVALILLEFSVASNAIALINVLANFFRSIDKGSPLSQHLQDLIFVLHGEFMRTLKFFEETMPRYLILLFFFNFFPF